MRDRHSLNPVDASLCEVEELIDFDRTEAAVAPPRPDDALSFYDNRWLQAWGHAFLPNRGWARPLTLYSVKSGSATLGFLALARQSVSRLRVRSLAGYYWPFRTMSVRDDDCSRKAFATGIASHFMRRPPATVLRFGPVSSLDKALDELLGAFAARGWTALRHDGGEIFGLDLPDDATALQDSVSASLLKNARYCRRRMEKQFGGVTFERHVLGPDSIALLDTLDAVEAASWVAKQSGEIKFIGAANRKFWTSLGQATERPSDVVIWILRCATEPIAFSAHIETGETVYIIANSYDERWKSHSPGAVLSLELLGDACRRGKRRVDWGQGDSGYKSRWGATASTRLFDVMLFRPGIRGRAMYTLAQRFLPGWHRMDRAHTESL